LWHTVLTDPTSYEETSGSGAIVGGMLKGIRMGILDESFKECTALKTVTLSKRLKEIEYMTFQDCSSLISIELHEGIESVGNQAFNGCSQLETIVIPKSVTKMAAAFSGCPALDIYCRASVVPSGWTSGWNGGRPVTWGYRF
jgi:hypothetical protein